ncbi:MAG TPA: class I SAM-dependent methyltransferase [Candidatus Methylacidiphilales bacterium]
MPFENFVGPFPYRPVLHTQHPIAFESPDHLHPWGTARDNSRNPAFNAKVFELFDAARTGPLRVMDLGCSGGGFVKDMVDAGHFGVGLEGSDYSFKHKRAEWATIPGNLATCDVSKPYDLLTESGERVHFDLITSWEVLEHLTEEGFDAFLLNLRKHLDPERGLFIGSVSLDSSKHEGEELHQTIQPESWWLQKIRDAGFKLLEPALLYFDLDWLRGPIQAAPGSFHVVFGLPTCKAHDARVLELVARDARLIYGHTYAFYEELVKKCADLERVAGAYVQAAEMAKQAAVHNEALKRKFAAREAKENAAE